MRRRWVDEATYTDLVALCQFLPGPASSQVGFSLGLIRAGYWGGLAAWTGFTLPSAVLLTAFAYGAEELGGPIGQGVIHGLKLVAVAIVAQAVWGMARSFCPDRQRASIACVAALLILLSNSPATQIGTILLGGIAGAWLCRAPGARIARDFRDRRFAPSRHRSAHDLLPFTDCTTRLARVSQGVALFDAFYRSGALVFGGGHVVLPLLSKAFVTPGWVSEDAFLAGYGAAQAVPGPLFTFAAYLGAVVTPRAAWHRGRSPGAGRHFPARHLGSFGRIAVLGCVSAARGRASHHAGSQRGRRRAARGGTLQSPMDKLRQVGGRFRHCTAWIRFAHGLAHVTVGHRYPGRARRGLVELSGGAVPAPSQFPNTCGPWEVALNFVVQSSTV